MRFARYRAFSWAGDIDSSLFARTFKLILFRMAVHQLNNVNCPTIDVLWPLLGCVIDFIDVFAVVRSDGAANSTGGQSFNQFYYRRFGREETVCLCLCERCQSIIKSKNWFMIRFDKRHLIILWKSFGQRVKVFGVHAEPSQQIIFVEQWSLHAN